MKRIKQIALSVVGMAFIATGFVACSSDDSENVYNSSEETYESISSMTTLSQKQNAFDYLTNQEKYNVWQYKYDSFLNENELSQEEKDFVMKLKDSFTPEMFDQKSNEHKIFQTVILDDLFNEALQVFEPRDRILGIKGKMANFLLFELDGYVVYGDDDEDSGDGGDLYVCSCAIGSKYTCGRITGGGIGVGQRWVDFSLSIEYGECGNKNCVKTKSGCGGLWASDCTGSDCTY